MKYKVLFNYDTEKLEEQVNYFLKNGWKLQGGISVTFKVTGQNLIYAQAMTKED